MFRNTRLEAEADVLPFSGYTVNEGQAFDLVTGIFTAQQGGLYWLHWSVGMEAGSVVKVTLRGFNTSPNIIREHNSFTITPVTTSRDALVQLETGNEMWLRSDSALFSDAYLQTTFSAFPLSDVSSAEPVAFSVALSMSLVNAGFIKIPYDVINIDTHGAWNPSTSDYIVPANGTYVITSVTGVYPNDPIIHDLLVNEGERRLITSTFYFTSHAGADTISRTVIATLRSGDRLYSQLTMEGYSAYSDTGYQTALLGFLYSPLAFSPVSWSVKTNVAGPASGVQDPFPFQTVMENQGSGWNEESNTFSAPQAGTYYVHLSAGIYYGPTKMELMINSFSFTNVHFEPYFDGFSTLSRALIVRLSAGDVLHIRLPFGYTLATNSYVESTFSGFLLHL